MKMLKATKKVQFMISSKINIQVITYPISTAQVAEIWTIYVKSY